MKIDRPIFVVGSGRSGTTILYNILSTHQDLCWFSTYSNIFPSLPNIAILHRIFDIPGIGRSIRNSIPKKDSFKFTPRPTEGGNIYHNYCGFEHGRKTTEDDFDQDKETKLKKIIKKHLKATGKKRFISKQTANNQRIRLINKMFPNAYYVHIIRDGRAVANSLFHVNWWNDVDNWFGDNPSKWQEMGNDPIVLCGMSWEKDVEEILTNKYLFEDRYIEIRYENLVEDTKNIVRKIIDFCELQWSDVFGRNIPPKLPNMNYKWKEQLTETQKKKLNESLKKSLDKFDYD